LLASRHEAERRWTLALKIKNRKDFGSTLFLFALGLFMALESMKFRVWGLRGPGEGFFPLAIAMIIIGVSLLTLVESIWQGQAEGGKEKCKDQGEISVLRVSCYAFLMVLYGLSMKKIGFFITTPLFLFLILKYVEKQPWKATIMIVILATMVTGLLFRYWLEVPLPMGLMKEW
jgi:hypothetical protein